MNDVRLRCFSAALHGKALKPHQVVGSQWLAQMTSGVLGDDGGCGKSAQVLKAAGQSPRLFIVSPKIMRGVISNGAPMGGWADEAKLWRPDLKVSILSKKGAFRWPEPGEVVLMNYEILPGVPSEVLNGKDVRVAAPPPPGVILVADEAHALANAKTLQTQRFRRLSHMVLANKGRCWGVTATALKNDPQEIYEVCHSIGCAVSTFGSMNDFAEMCERKFTGFVRGKPRYRLDNPSPEVAEKLKRVMLRRKKRDVMDLPPISFRRVVVQIEDEAIKKLCDTALSEIQKTGLDVEQAMEVLNEAKEEGIKIQTISGALESLSRIKTVYGIELAESYERSKTPGVFFTGHVAAAQALARSPGWGLVTGQGCGINTSGVMEPKNSQEVIAAFRDGKIDRLAATIHSMGVGVNGLQRASDVILVSKLWSPAMNNQAIWRVDRMGQKNPVMVTDVVGDHPLDFMMSAVLERKLDHFNRTVDAVSTK